MDRLIFQEEDHVYKLDGVEIPSVTQIIKAAGLSNFDFVDPQVMERAIQFGNAVHKSIELKSKGKLDEDSVDDAIKGHILQWDKFCADFRYLPSFSEYRFFNSTLRVGYTIDSIGWIGSESVLVDIKTGSPKCADIVQTCAYGYLYAAKRILILYLKEDRYLTLEPKGRERKKGEQLFLSALSLYNYKKQEGLL